MSRKLVILISIAASLLLIVIVLFMGVTTSPRPEPSTPHSIHLLKNKHALRLIEKNELEENLKGRTEEYVNSEFWYWQLNKDSSELVINYSFEHDNVKNDSVSIYYHQSNHDKFISAVVNNEKREITIKISDINLITNWEPQTIDFRLDANKDFVLLRFTILGVL